MAVASQAGPPPAREDAAAALGASLARHANLLQRVQDDPSLAARLRELQSWQAARLAACYADQRCDARRVPAVEFFLTDVYGPHDFSARDGQLQRASQLLARTLPGESLQGLAEALEMQVLSLELDLEMAAHLPPDTVVDERVYGEAYRATARRADRERQIALVGALGARLARLVRHVGIEIALRLAAGPARFAGYGELQSFLERGFAAFRSLGPATAEFLATIERRERAFMQAQLQGPEPQR